MIMQKRIRIAYKRFVSSPITGEEMWRRDVEILGRPIAVGNQLYSKLSSGMESKEFSG